MQAWNSERRARQTLRDTREIHVDDAADISTARRDVVHGQDNFKMLVENEIRARVIGRDITDASHWTMYLRPDGALIGTESDTRWTGTWKLQKNKLCMSSPGSKLLDCYEVWMSSERISLRLKKDDDSFVAVIERHKTN